MPENIAAGLWLGLAAYGSLGALVWIALILGLMRRLDTTAVTAPWRVKAVLAAGIIALWPIMLVRLFKPREGVS